MSLTVAVSASTASPPHLRSLPRTHSYSDSAAPVNPLPTNPLPTNPPATNPRPVQPTSEPPIINIPPVIETFVQVASLRGCTAE